MKLTTKDQFKIWSYVALHSFGGPAGQIAVIHKLIVDDKKLMSEEKFLHALNFCMLLPGPEAQQLATYIGWHMNKWKGGVIAGGLFILPGFLSILALSYLYVIFDGVPLVEGLFYGVKPAIIAIVIAALLKISKRSLENSFYWGIAICSFLSLFFFHVPFPIVVLMSGMAGMLKNHLSKIEEIVHIDSLPHPSFYQTVKTLIIWISIWIFPIVLVYFILGKDSTLHTMNIFFSKMAMVTFGGAYGALNYVAQQAVDVFGWVRGHEMIDGLAMAESTPGPLIQTVQFVGFMGAYRFPDGGSPLMSAFFGSVLSTWMTFAPCFLWIFTFAPYLEYLRSKKVLNAALRAIMASVVGVILNLSLWFTLKALFLQSKRLKIGILDVEYPIIDSLDAFALGICLLALLMQFRFKKNLFFILGVCMVLGLLKFTMLKSIIL